MRTILFILYQPYKWLVYIPFLIVSTTVFGILAVIISTVINPKIGSLIGGMVWSRLNGYMTPIFVKVEGRKNIDPKQSYVITSNHQSHFDIFILYGWLGIDFKWIMKQELRKVPFLGIGCEKVGHIFIDRSNHEAAVASINAAKKKVVNGTSVIFFPEGTRSKTGKTGEFKKGAFIMALDLGLPILPVTIMGSRKILPPGTMNLLPGRIRLVIHPPVSTEGYTDKNITELMDKVRKVMVAPIEGK